MVIGNTRETLRRQGVLRHTDEEIMEGGVDDWRAVLMVMSEGPYFFGHEPRSIDATVFGALAPTIFTPIESPVRDFVRAQPTLANYADRMRARFFPELAPSAEQTT
jgi:hypothetical protein